MSSDFWAFRTMVAPVIIRVIFWVGSVIFILIGLAIVLGGIHPRPGGALGAGLGFIILGPIVVRIYCELLIVFFRINETLTEIKHALEPRETEPTRPEAA